MLGNREMAKSPVRGSRGAGAVNPVALSRYRPGLRVFPKHGFAQAWLLFGRRQSEHLTGADLEGSRRFPVRRHQQERAADPQPFAFFADCGLNHEPWDFQKIGSLLSKGQREPSRLDLGEHFVERLLPSRVCRARNRPNFKATRPLPSDPGRFRPPRDQ